MPTGQISPLNVDPVTGATLDPSVILDDDFNTNRLTNYVLARTNVAGNTLVSGLLVSGGVLGITDTGIHIFRNQRSHLNSRTAIQVRVGNSATHRMDCYIKYIDNNNYLFMRIDQTNATQIQVYSVVAGVTTNLGATLQKPSLISVLEPWYVFRLAVSSSSSSLRAELYANPPNLGFAPSSNNTFGINAIFGGAGYSGLGLEGQGVANDWKFMEWTVVDDTNRTNF